MSEKFIFTHVILYSFLFRRLLEYYILNGPKDDAIDHVIKELSNEKRRNPQELDREVVEWLKDVVEKKNEDHITAARKYKLSCSKFTA